MVTVHRLDDDPGVGLRVPDLVGVVSDFKIERQFEPDGNLTVRPFPVGKGWLVTLWAANAAGLEVGLSRYQIEKLHTSIGRLLEENPDA